MKTDDDKKALWWLRLGLYATAGMFLARLVFLNLILGGYYEKMAGNNRIREEKILPLRGAILTKNGEYLALNKDLNGKPVRHYPLGEIGASVTGFEGEISEEELEKCEENCYLGKLIGKTGLESRYEVDLAGVPGVKIIEETALGVKTKEIKKSESLDGKDLVINLDLGLQRKVYWALKNLLNEKDFVGAAGVVSKLNGEVLALVSLPSFDPNLFVKGGSRGEEGGSYPDALSVVNDKLNRPMFNRVISGAYPPGSVFKLVVAVAGLEEKIVDKNKTVEDTGEIKVGESRFGNWYFDRYGKTEGSVNIEKALARSNDIYFYKLGEWLGVDRIIDWSKKFAVGEKTEIDLPAEAGGFLPTPLWREKKTGERWLLGNTYHLAIGQGDLLVTPLQINRLTASVFSGKVCKPRMISGEVVCKNLKISESTRNLVASGMKGGCMSGGTAFSFFSLDGKVYCKTGTAQHGGKNSKPHAWITVVVPSSELRAGGASDEGLVVTVMVEEAGEGSEVAGPVARKIVDYILR